MGTFSLGLTISAALLLITTVSSLKYPKPRTEGPDFWYENAQRELRKSLEVELNTNIAKNVILFIGDGMGFTTVWASRIYTGQHMHDQSGEEYEFEFMKFPHVGLSKTYNADRQIPDSAGTATAYLCGVKANFGTVGVNEYVARSNCSNQAENKVTSILDWSKAAGKATGIVTTARITHASPSAAYAHSAERYWENDAELNFTVYGVPPDYNQQFNCKDIAQQLIEENSDIDVLLGGGRRAFRPSNVVDEEYPSQNYRRLDGRDLIQEWIDDKNNRNKKNSFVWNKDEFDEVDPANTDYLLGLFEPAEMQYELQRNKAMEPSLADLTRKAIKVLQKDDDGFFLFVEGARIDHAHHNGQARLALEEVAAMDEAIKAARELTNMEDTLIVVTSDHGHTFTTGGYPSRGLDILGLGDNWEDQPPLDNLPYTTLLYANGPGALINQPRADLTDVDTRDGLYQQPGLVPMERETHGGEDVGIYASGPMAHLFHNVHEQNYIAHVMAYASCVGNNQEHCDKAPPPPRPPSAATMSQATAFLVALVALLGYFAAKF